MSKKNTKVKKVFVTGGAGFIGSHTCVQLLDAGYEVLVYDNLSNSSDIALERVEKITNKTLSFAEGDIRNEQFLTEVMAGYDAVIHFAGLKAVGESVQNPLEYYDNNVHGTLCLLRAMKKNNIKKIVFSSSATVYGKPMYLPFTEKHRLRAMNPYGRSKAMIEEILCDFYRSDNKWAIAILRYFNPVGAHESGFIGEAPQGVPNNLMPFVGQVATGKRKILSIFGNDYLTVDGTGIRDYIHVVDLANGHLKALNILNKPQCEAINLGTGNGYSVLDVVKAYEKASGKTIKYKFVPRRDGDIASYYADSSKAKKQLHWQAKYDLEKMCVDEWRWQVNNPDGY